MAHLLGSQYCIESLRRDVTDLQGAVTDVFSRTGPLRTQSWKYPDKVAADLDLTQLLELYDWSEEEEERQVAHIVLLELVIDRLVLLLQGVSTYLDSVPQSKRPTTSNPQPAHSSVGLVVKKFWARLMQTYSGMDTKHRESERRGREVKSLQAEVAELQSQLDQHREEAGRMNSTLSNFPIPLNEADSRLAQSVRHPAAYNVSRDESNKACQTVETAFVPCEACGLVQKALRDAGGVVVSVCKSQGLPSSLLKHKGYTEHTDWMTGTDVAHWTCEQNKDLQRINKHMEQLEARVNPLKEELAAEQKRSKDMQARVGQAEQEVRLERETQATQRKQYEAKLAQLDKDRAASLSAACRDKEHLEKKKKDIEKELAQVRKELLGQGDLNAELDEVRRQLQEEQDVGQRSAEHTQQLQHSLTECTAKLDTLTAQLQEVEKECSREKAKNKSVAKHTEAVQKKQQGLVGRLDELSEENEELRGQVGALEEQLEGVQEALERAQEQHNQAQDQLSSTKVEMRREAGQREAVQGSVAELEQEVAQLQAQLQDAREQQRLLVQYPDLNGLVNTDLAGTGDVGQDMENQVKANSLRIQVLEEQNTALRRSITKMLQATQQQQQQQQQQQAPPSVPVPLWQPAQSSPSSDLPPRHPHREAGGSAAGTDRYTGAARHQGPSPPQAPSQAKDKTRNKSAPARPRSGVRQGSASSIHAYRSLKQSGLLTAQGLQQQQQQQQVGEDYEAQEVYACHKCDKMYNSRRDLEVHKSYCYGGI